LVKNRSTFIVVLLVSGCATVAKVPEAPRVVEVPVAVECPHPKVPERPHLPIADLTDKSEDSDVVKAYAATVQALKDYAAALELLLQAQAGSPSVAPSSP
jgi:hypothetical protein